MAGLMVCGGFPHQLGERPDSQLFLQSFFRTVAFAQFFLYSFFLRGWIDGLWRGSAPFGGTTGFAILFAQFLFALCSFCLHCVFCTVFFSACVAFNNSFGTCDNKGFPSSWPLWHKGLQSDPRIVIDKQQNNVSISKASNVSRRPLTIADVDLGIRGRVRRHSS